MVGGSLRVATRVDIRPRTCVRLYYFDDLMGEYRRTEGSIVHIDRKTILEFCHVSHQNRGEKLVKLTAELNTIYTCVESWLSIDSHTSQRSLAQ